MEDLVCGIDEAGRGCVIGPLVIAACVIKREDKDMFRKLGVKDSKLVLPKKREELYTEIYKFAKDIQISIIEPTIIDSALKNPNMNLNLLEADYSCKLISSVNCDIVYVDCPSVNTGAYKKEMLSRISKPVNLFAEHKADVRHACVACASIIAKVVRDREIRKIKDNLGIDFGSGYMSDKKTQLFLKSNYGKYHNLFRTMWVSYRRLEGAKSQKTLSNFENE